MLKALVFIRNEIYSLDAIRVLRSWLRRGIQILILLSICVCYRVKIHDLQSCKCCTAIVQSNDPTNDHPKKRAGKPPPKKIQYISTPPKTEVHTGSIMSPEGNGLCFSLS